MRFSKAEASLAALLYVSVACGSSDPPGGTKFAEAKSALTRASEPVVADADRSIFVADNTAFAVDLFRVVATANENTLVSPHSVSTALAMTYAGAAGTTHADIGRALHFTLPEEKLHPAFNWIDLELAKRAEAAVGKDGGAARLNVDNELFGAIGAKFVPSYLDTLAVNYGSGVKLVDFEGAAADSTAKINAHVEERTEGRIKNLLAAPLDTSTRFVLVNTVYANAAWSRPFTRSETAMGTFKSLAGDVQVAMMKHSFTKLAYASDERAEVVELALSGDQLVFDVILPKTTVAEYESRLTGGELTQLLRASKERLVTVAVPKFRLEPKQSTSLKSALSTLGMASAFEGADLSRMLAEPLKIADVVHKTFLEIDEDGLEAAAATGVIGEATSAPADPPVTVTVDRPFLVVLRDRPTGQILFLGHVTDPR